MRTGKAWLWGLAGAGAVWAVKQLIRQRRRMEFTGKTVVITGGSRGLGLVLARQLAEAGANIALCARDIQELERAKQQILPYNPLVLTYPCDVTDRDQVNTFISDVIQVFGKIDVLINNAGIILVSPLAHLTDTDFRESMDTNFWASYYTINAVLPHMRRQGMGRIVNIASFGGKVSVPHLLPYSVSKFTLVGYSEGLRAELQSGNILVTTVCPGLMRTGSPRNATFKGQHEKEYAWFKIGDSLPFLTMEAEESARQILDACRHGDAELIISWPAKLANAVHGLMPNLTAEALALVNDWLPEPGGIGENRRLGKESETALSASPLARLTDQAAVANNEGY